jgi:hypothetical protein
LPQGSGSSCHQGSTQLFWAERCFAAPCPQPMALGEAETPRSNKNGKHYGSVRT